MITSESALEFRIIHVQFNVHPCTVDDLAKIISPQMRYTFNDLMGMKITGCLNILTIEDVTNSPMETTHPDPLLKQDWLKAVTMKRSVGLQDDTPLFMVQSGYIERRGLVTGPIPILPDDLHRAKVLKIAKQRYPKWCTWDNPMTWLVILYFLRVEN